MRQILGALLYAWAFAMAVLFGLWLIAPLMLRLTGH